MRLESAIASGEATAGRERPVDLDTDVPASSVLSESMAKRPFALFFASTGGEHGAVHDSLFTRSTSGTPLLSEKPSQQPETWIWRAPEPTREDQIARLNNERVALLARKYVAKENFNDEESARLAIVTERVRKLLPAVAAKEYEVLEHILKLVKQARETDKGLRERVGIARRRNG